MARPTRRRGNLPAEATSFVGRRRELAELRKKLASVRLVTLVGPGGVGKTRLAIRIGTDLARAFPDGAWLVELADVRDPGLVGNAVLAALDLRDQAATEPRALLLSHLRDRKLLLLVDNCEHLLEAAALLVTDVLRAAPGVRVVATSREPLSVTGEHVIPIPPLELPRAQGDETLDQLRLNESVELFTERAAAASGRFELTTSNRMAVVDVCRRLDGLPLAIELAAVRTRVLSVEQIDDRLSDRFGLLTGGSRAALPRHQTLRTTIEWSHDLLKPEERALFRRLSAFAGRFTLDDVGSVCAFDDVPPATVLDVLSSLVDKSLVLKDDVQGIACYRLHESMREFAGLRTREAGEEEAVELRCIDHYVSEGRRNAAQARFRLVAWLGWMDVEIDNIRWVLRRCALRGDAARGTGLAVDVGWYWITRSMTEGVRWLDELLAMGPGDAVSHAGGLFMRGFLALLQVDPVAARPLLERAAEAQREAGRPGPLVNALAMASIAAHMTGDRRVRAAAARRGAGRGGGPGGCRGPHRGAAGPGLRWVLRGRPGGGRIGFLGGRTSQPGVGRPVRARHLAHEPGDRRVDRGQARRGEAAVRGGAADRAPDRRPGVAVPPARRIGLPGGGIRAGAARGAAPRGRGHRRRRRRRARHAIPGAARGAGRVVRDRGARAIPVRRRLPCRESPGPGRRRAPRARRIQRGRRRRRRSAPTPVFSRGEKGRWPG